MLLTYQFELKVNNRLGIILGHLTYAASKLFNIGNYERKEYKSLGFDTMPNWYDQKKRLKDDIWYKSLPSQTSQDVLAILDRSWKSYLTLHNKWAKKNKDVPFDKRKDEPQSPYYKKDGYHMNVPYLSNAFKIVNNKIRFSIPKRLKEHLKDKYQIADEFFYIKLKKSFKAIKQIEFCYINKDKYQVYVIYEKEIKPLALDNKHFISIDIGVKNLLSVYDNNGSSFIVSGHSILNNNYYFSKKIAYYQSLFDKNNPKHKKGETTKRIKCLYEKKNKRIKLALHRATKTIVDYCLANNVSKVIIGDLMGLLETNKEFASNKEKHRFNQNVRAINFSKIYRLLDYKLKLVGIELIKVNEAYSSTCSPNSPLVNKEYSNKSNRIHRGLFKDGDMVYNADIVGAYNIMKIYRQINGNDFIMPIVGLSNPKKVYIPVTDQFLNEDYVNWNGKAGNIGISGRNYPNGEAFVDFINERLAKMLGYSIAE